MRMVQGVGAANGWVRGVQQRRLRLRGRERVRDHGQVRLDHRDRYTRVTADTEKIETEVKDVDRIRKHIQVDATLSRVSFWVYSHDPSIWSQRGTKVICPDFQPMRVSEEPVCIDIFRQNPVFTSLHLKSPMSYRLWGISHSHNIIYYYPPANSPPPQRKLPDGQFCTG